MNARMFLSRMSGAIIHLGVGSPAELPKYAAAGPTAKPQPPRLVDTAPNSALATFGGRALHWQDPNYWPETQRACDACRTGPAKPDGGSPALLPG
jgi:hypothetical protein